MSQTIFAHIKDVQIVNEQLYCPSQILVRNEAGYKYCSSITPPWSLLPELSTCQVKISLFFCAKNLPYSAFQKLKKNITISLKNLFRVTLIIEKVIEEVKMMNYMSVTAKNIRGTLAWLSEEMYSISYKNNYRNY